MKLQILSITLLSILSMNIFFNTQARTVIHNDSAYPIRALINWAGFGGPAEFPENGLLKQNDVWVQNPDANVALTTGKEADVKRDLFAIKNSWKVWAYIDDQWKQVIDSGEAAGGLAIRCVDAYIRNTVDEKTGEPVFTLTLKTL